MLQPYYPEPSRKLFLPFTYPIVLGGFVRVDMCNNLLDCYSDEDIQTILDKGIMPSEKVLDFPVDCNTLTGSVNL